MPKSMFIFWGSSINWPETATQKTELSQLRQISDSPGLYCGLITQWIWKCLKWFFNESMIVNGFTPQRVNGIHFPWSVACAFTPFLFTSRASANQACRQADISSNASTRHMSCALDVYHPDESANLPNMFCNCAVHLVCWWFVHNILFNTFRSKQPRRTSFAIF